MKAFVKPILPTTDSGRLILHLDSLPKIKFPFKSEWYNRTFPTVCISEFKNKKLFNLPLKLIPTQIGLDDDEADSTFNLVDTTYRGKWNLIIKKPNFIVLEVENHLVTMAYDLKVIDAINSAGAQGNNHWNVERFSTIYKNLKIVIHNEYIVQVDEAGNFETQAKWNEKWFIDKNGHFKKK